MENKNNEINSPEQQAPGLPSINSKNQLATSILNTAVSKGWVNTSNLFIQVLFVLPAVVTAFMGQSDLEDKNLQLEEQNKKIVVIVEELQKQNLNLTQKSKELTRQITVSLSGVEKSLNMIATEGKKLQYRTKMLENHNGIVYPDHIKSMIEPEFDLNQRPLRPEESDYFKSLSNMVEDSTTNMDLQRDEVDLPLPSVNFDQGQ
jgi:hypothetical protein